MNAVRYRFEDSTIVNTWAEAKELAANKGEYETIYVHIEPEELGIIAQDPQPLDFEHVHQGRALPKIHSRT